MNLTNYVASRKNFKCPLLGGGGGGGGGEWPLSRGLIYTKRVHSGLSKVAFTARGVLMSEVTFMRASTVHYCVYVGDYPLPTDKNSGIF